MSLERVNYNRRLIPIYNPSMIWPTVLALSIYLPPYLISVLYNKKALESFVAIVYEAKFLTLGFIILSSILLLLVTVIKVKLKLNLSLIKLSNSSMNLVIIFYFLMGIYAILNIFILLNFNDRIIQPLLSRNMPNVILGINIVGGDISKSGAARSYLFLQVSVVASILFISLPGIIKNRFIKYLLMVFVFSGALLLCIMSRREAIIFIFLSIFYCVPVINKIDFNLRRASAFLIVILLIFIVMIRIGDYNILSYINSQEFYPVQYGAYLIGDDLSGNSRFDVQTLDLSQLSFTQVLFNEPTLSGMESFRRFGLIGYGPTVSIFYTLYKFWMIPIVILFSLSVIFNSYFTQERIKNPVDRLLYIYVCIKWFFLIRNGEFSLFTWDILIFLILLYPVTSLTSVRIREGERYE